MADIFAEPLYRDLEKLGFTVNESKVYLVLIRIGSSLAGNIAKEASLDRSSTYNALKALIQRGIVSTAHETKRTIYIPADPKKIIDYFKEKEEIAQKIIPNLRKHFTATKEKKQILLFTGFKGLKTIFNDVIDSLKPNQEYFVISSEGQFGDKMPYYAPIFRKRKQERGIKTKMLIRQGRPKKTKSKRTEYRALPQDVASPATINVYNDKVAIIMWEEPPQAILIENPKVAKTFKNYFSFMWKHAKKV